MKVHDIAVIGAGPAGLAAAIRCNELGIKNTVLIERDSFAGGILPQCIHNGFGLKFFNKELTGPEYCQVFIDKLKENDVNLLLDTMALEIKKPSKQKNGSPGYFEIIIAGKKTGFEIIKAKAIILALGCRERTRGQIMIPGARPSGVITAGLAQRMVNIEGYLPGKEIVILGSGDIGLIMARRLSLEGCKVKGVYELMPFSTGLLRNISQCLDDFGIPLFLSHTVTEILGNKRVEAVKVAPVDEGLKPVLEKACRIKCDTLLLSVGLIPENELSKTCGVQIDYNTGGPTVYENFQTSVPGVFSCGNSLFVYDIVDEATKDGYAAAESAARYLIANASCENINAEVLFDKESLKLYRNLYGSEAAEKFFDIEPGENVAYAVPQKISGLEHVNFKIRPKKPLKNAIVQIYDKQGEIFSKKIRYVNPGEMIFLDVSKEHFRKYLFQNHGRKLEHVNHGLKELKKITLSIKNH
ncbi:MAG: NAD(P)/FAD-dependent oxidoreductase [Actinobacteria bacterium]|nr:NAD(P)/FAD-dependent oxidoreductase [Actinomycetota bacterium]